MEQLQLSRVKSTGGGWWKIRALLFSPVMRYYAVKRRIQAERVERIRQALIRTQNLSFQEMAEEISQFHQPPRIIWPEPIEDALGRVPGDW